MRKTAPARIPAEWANLQPGEFMFSRKPYHELQEIAGQLKKSGVRVSLQPTHGGYHVRCESRKAA